MTENLWIKNIELNNFQKHGKLNIEFTKDVNVIHGDSGKGKSCIVRAIKWVFFNDPKGDVIRKEGSKTTSVKVELSTGAKIERIKSASINAYIISKEGMEDKRFDSIGKDIPEEVQQVLQVSTFNVEKEKLILNIANQLTLPFLMNESGTFRSKLFNKMTGNDITDKVSGGLNKDILEKKRSIKSEEADLEKKKVHVEEIEKDKNKLENTYKESNSQYLKIIEINKQYEKLNDIKNLLIENNETIKDAEETLKNIKIIDQKTIDDLKKLKGSLEDLESLSKNIKLNNEEILELEIDIKACKIPDIDEMEDLYEIKNKFDSLESIYKSIRRVDEEISELNEDIKNYKIPDIDVSDLKEMSSQLKSLQTLSKELKEVSTTIDNTTLEIKDLSEDIEEFTIEYKEILKKSGKCPTCKSNVTDDVLEGITI